MLRSGLILNIEDNYHVIHAEIDKLETEASIDMVDVEDDDEPEPEAMDIDANKEERPVLTILELAANIPRSLMNLGLKRRKIYCHHWIQIRGTPPPKHFSLGPRTFCLDSHRMACLGGVGIPI